MATCGIDLEKGDKVCKKGVTKNTEFCVFNTTTKKCNFNCNPDTHKKYTLKQLEQLARINPACARRIRPRPDDPIDAPPIEVYRRARPDPEMLPPLLEVYTDINPLTKIPVNVKVFRFSEFSEVKALGLRGTYGSAYLAKLGEEKVILKKYVSYNKRQGITADIYEEIILLQHLNKYPETKTVKFYGVAFNDDDTEIYLVLEALHSDLHKSILRTDMRLTAKQRKIIFYKLVSAFNAIHSLGVIHNDIKAANIMLMKQDGANEFDIRIIDFGLAEFIGISPLKQFINLYACTEDTKAPDDRQTRANFLDGSKKYHEGNRKSFTSDSYSLAITIMHICYRSYNEVRVKDSKIYFANELELSYETPDRFGAQGADLIKRMLEPNAKLRYTCKQALAHPYFRDLNKEENVIINLAGGNILPNYDKIVSRYINYSFEEYIERKYELAYMDEMHLNYMNDVIEYRDISRSTEITYKLVTILFVWLNDVYISKLISNIDILINTFDLTLHILNNNNIPIRELQLLGIMNSYPYVSILDVYADLYDYAQVCDHAYTLETMINFTSRIIKLSNCNISFKPVWLHLYYIYLKLEHMSNKNIQNERGETVDLTRAYAKILQLSTFYIVFYYLFLERPPINFTIWNIVQYSVTKAISKLLEIDIEFLASNPFHPILENSNFSHIHTYYNICKERLRLTDLKSKTSIYKNKIDLL
jgi:serine/threonine protein kinase